MTLGIILALIWVIFMGITSVTQKFLAEKYEEYIALLIQYAWVLFFSLIFTFFITRYEGIALIPSISLINLWILILVWVVWFIGIRFLWKWFEKLNWWITLIIANLSVFLMYFLNILIFDTSEQLSLIKIIFGILFFIVVSQLLLWKPILINLLKSLFKKDKSDLKLIIKDIWINKAVLYPVITAICRALFFVWNTYFIKYGILHPIQSVLLTEWMVFIVAVLAFIFIYKWKFWDIVKTTKKKHLWIYALWTFSLVLWSFLLYYAYLDTPANIVNVIRLFTIISTSILAWIFIKDKMSKRNIILMIIAFVILMWFIFI